MYEWVFNHGYNRVSVSYERQVVNLCPIIFQEGWLTCLNELCTATKHQAWTIPAPEAKLLDLPEAYSPLILLGFNEEQYINQSTEEEKEGLAEVGGTDKGNELGVGEGEDGIGDENQDIPLKCNMFYFLKGGGF